MSGDSMIHLVSGEGGAHAIYKLVRLDAGQQRDPEGYSRVCCTRSSTARSRPRPPQARPFGFSSFNFGNQKGVAGFALWRLNGDVLSVWIAGVPAGDIAWAEPLTGACCCRCAATPPLAPQPLPRDPALAATSVSSRCLAGRCEDSDFAATYLDKFRLGYVHAHDGEVFLVNPRRDFWQNGPEGPGFYHQIGGENEKLEPGRTN